MVTLTIITLILITLPLLAIMDMSLYQSTFWGGLKNTLSWFNGTEAFYIYFILFTMLAWSIGIDYRLIKQNQSTQNENNQQKQ